ncbi:hypothetical protein ACFU9Y_37870 [Streptomyces sp. NPDC057621]|uniref:hypothetical protein n=1 Tax=Streptomyces sp. NPDC057621 TaxID=3346186 RepID=UPI00368D7507
MDPITLAAGSALVAAMATDGWQHARDAVVAWWRSRHPNQTDSLHLDLERLRTQVLAARQEGNQPGADTLAAAWGVRFQQLLDDTPDLDAELRELIDRTLSPMTSTTDQDDAPAVAMKADARDHARIYMAARDQHITGS